MTDTPRLARAAADPRAKVARVAILLLVIALTVYIFSIRDQAPRLARYGYPGIFVLNVLANATVLLPAPGIALVFAFGSVFEPFWVGIVAGAGATIGELSGYAAGFSGRAAIENAATYQRLLNWMSRNNRAALVVLVLMATIPNPVFDLVGVAAGVLRIRLWHFLLATLVGKILKMWIFAYAGAFSLGWVYQLIQ